MHGNGCISSNLSDVFPSIPVQDTIPCGQLLNVNSINSADVTSRLKYLGLNAPSHSMNPGGVFFNEDRSRTNLIINYLPQSYDQNDLQRLFERVGPIRQCKLIRDKNTGASLCYGFVDFVNPQHAALAIQTYHGYETEQKRLRVAYASSGGRRIAPGHRAGSFIGTGANGPANEVTNENIIGWEIFVVGIPLEWTEPDLLRLFNNFGNVILIRLLAPQLSESPPSHKPRLSPPILNGGSSDLSGDSSDNTRVTTTASIIFEEKSSAELSVLRLNGYQAPDWSTPLRLRIIGSVTRESYGLFCLPSRQSPALLPSRLPNGQTTMDPLTESDALTHLLNRKVLGASNCMPNTFSKTLDPNMVGSNDLHSNAALVVPRAIMRNKELLELLDTQAQSNTGLLGASDRLISRDLTNMRSHLSEQENVKSDLSLRALHQGAAAWNYASNRSVLSTLPEVTRGTEGLPQAILTGVQRRLMTKTPLLLSSVLTNIASPRGCQLNIWLKLENVQATGSFKIRGMENVCRKWSACGVAHVVCPSGGNAAIAAACAAHAYGISCTIVMPETAESSIRRRLLLETPDAKVIVHGSDWLEAHQRAEQLVNEMQVNHPGESTKLLHPYDQSELWEGYETIIDELGPEIGQPDVIVVSVGGGGLLAGIIQGLWNKGWSSTHVVAVETEGADCLNRSLKSGQLVVVPRPTSIATSLSAPIVAQRTWNLAQLQSLTTLTCTDSDAIDAVKQFLDDHGMLVEPACGASLSTLYTGMIARLQMEGRIPRPANVVVIIGGGRNVSLRQLSEWESQTSNFGTIQQVTAPFLPPMTSPYMTNTSPGSASSDLALKQNMFASHLAVDPDETLKCGSSNPSTPRPVCTILSRPPVVTEAIDSHAPSVDGDREAIADGSGTLNPHDLVNFSKLLATEAEGDDEVLHE